MMTAGLLISIFDLPLAAPYVAVVLTVATALVLINGHYAKAEGIVKVLVIVFSVLTIITTVFALPQLGSDGRAVFAELTPGSRAGAVRHWARRVDAHTDERGGAGRRVGEGEGSGNEGGFRASRRVVRFSSELRSGSGHRALFHRNGYRGVSSSPDTNPRSRRPRSPPIFFSLFTTVVGQWMYPVIAAAGLAVMWSTQVALMDALPRVMNRLTCTITGRGEDQPHAVHALSSSTGRGSGRHRACFAEELRRVHRVRDQHGLHSGAGYCVLQLRGGHLRRGAAGKPARRTARYLELDCGLRYGRVRAGFHHYVVQRLVSASKARAACSTALNTRVLLSI